MSHSRCLISSKRRSRAITTAMLSSFALVIPACKLPVLCCPDKAQPTPETFNGPQTVYKEVSWENSAQVDLHTFFNDPILTSLVDQAIVDNQELKILAQDIRIAGNEVNARRGAYLPFFTFGARAGVEKSSEYTREGAVESNLTANGKSFPDPLPDFLVASNVSWEIDIWKRLRNGRSAAALRYLGTADGRNYVVTRLVADIADDYYELLALDKRLETLNKTIELQEKSLEFSKANKEAARGTELAVQRFQAEVRKNQSERFIIAQEIVEAENRINFSAGRYPQQVDRAVVDFINLNISDLSVGVPAQLLQNRGDIRQAERELAAAGLDVQIARARFYPSLNISAGVGYRAFDSGFLFSTPASLIYNAFGDVVAPLINRSAIKAAYLTANAQQLQAVYDYQRTVLNAFTEVINYMSKVEKYGQSVEVKKQQLESLEASVDAATKLFQNARAEYVEVLLAQRDLQEAKVTIIETKRQQLTAIVDTYQALGGGMVSNFNYNNVGTPSVTTTMEIVEPVNAEQVSAVPGAGVTVSNPTVNVLQAPVIPATETLNQVTSPSTTTFSVPPVQVAPPTGTP